MNETFGITDTDQDEQAPTSATFDFTSWVAGVQPTVRSVTLHQRADLVAKADQLERELRLAESVPEDDRGLNDESPTSIRRQLEQVAEEFKASALTVKVQGRSDAWTSKIEKDVKKRGVAVDTDEGKYEVILHQLAGAIIEPAGITVDALRALGEASEAQLRQLVVAFTYASREAPKVDLPFSSESSKSRGRGR